MNLSISRFFFTLLCPLLAAMFAMFIPGQAGAESVPGTVGPVVPEHPRRVVSLWPSASEILAALGAADKVVGVTIHDGKLPAYTGKTLTGGFAHPDIELVLQLKPDCVIVSPFQKEAIAALLNAKNIPLLIMDAPSIAKGEANIRKLGALTGKEKEAEALILRERRLLDQAKAKTEGLASHPRRAVRIMGFSRDGKHLIVPGDNSFQHEIVRAAGGKAPVFGREGGAIFISPEEWNAFNPEAIYSCGGLDAVNLRNVFSAPPWNKVAAVREGRIFSYPCELTCRIASQYGKFSLWLAGDIYGREFSEPENQRQKNTVLKREAVKMPYAYVRTAEITHSRLLDLPAATLLVHFKKPQTILSTLDGWREGITVIGNHSAPPASWSLLHYLGQERMKRRLLKLYGLEQKNSSFLFTGADVRDMARVEKSEDGLSVCVLATAGVTGNAMRAAEDKGRYVEPGTINLIVLSNRNLTPEAMTRALITVTEAKTAALEDLDIRSTYTGVPATGTGTDNIIVVSGEGQTGSMTGGHTKLGELMARASYEAVRDAVARHNNISASRDIFRRLEERQIFLSGLFAGAGNPDVARQVENVLLNPRYAGFLNSAFALADSDERALTGDTSAFSTLCLDIASELAGKKIAKLDAVCKEGVQPRIIQEALNALATGVARR